MAHHLLNVSPAIVVIKDLAELFHFKSEHTARNYVNNLLLTDHESGWKEHDGYRMKVQPVYEWCNEIEEGL